MQEKRYQTYAGWKRAIKAIDSLATFEGDRDICQALHSNGNVGLGEWTGETGVLYHQTNIVNHKTLKPDMLISVSIDEDCIILRFDHWSADGAFCFVQDDNGEDCYPAIADHKLMKTAKFV